MILRYTKHMGGGSAETYRGDFHIYPEGVVLLNDNADETFIPMHRVVDIERYRTEEGRTLRETFRSF